LRSSRMKTLRPDSSMSVMERIFRSTSCRMW
jgi:hypothetical protein